MNPITLLCLGIRMLRGGPQLWTLLVSHSKQLLGIISFLPGLPCSFIFMYFMDGHLYEWPPYNTTIYNVKRHVIPAHLLLIGTAQRRTHNQYAEKF